MVSTWFSRTRSSPKTQKVSFQLHCSILDLPIPTVRFTKHYRSPVYKICNLMYWLSVVGCIFAFHKYASNNEYEDFNYLNKVPWAYIHLPAVDPYCQPGSRYYQSHQTCL